jgi:hypothetical protein
MVLHWQESRKGKEFTAAVSANKWGIIGRPARRHWVNHKGCKLTIDPWTRLIHKLQTKKGRDEPAECEIEFCSLYFHEFHSITALSWLIKSLNDWLHVIQPSHFLKANTLVVGRFLKMFDFGERMND